MEELFDDLICLDEEGESLESSTSGNLPEIKQKTRHSGMQSESCVNHRKKHDNIPRCRFSGDRQMSPRYCFHEKTSDVKRIDFYGDAKSNRMRRMGNTNEFTIDTNLLEVDSCEGDDSDFSESGKNLSLNQSPGKGENRVDVSLTSSMALQIYGDDEDWPYLSGDVDEEAVRLAASLDPDVTEAKDDSQQGPRKEWNAMEMEKRTNRWNAQQYCNSNGSSHHSKTSDKLDDSKRPLRKFSPFAPSKGRRSVVHAHHEASHHVVDSEYSRYRCQELVKCHELSGRRDRMERISLFMSSRSRRSSLQTRVGPSLLYSRKTYVPYPSSCRKEDLLERSSGISGVVIKRSYQIKTQLLDNDAKKRKVSFENSVHRMGCSKTKSDIVPKNSAILPPIASAVLRKADEMKALTEEKYAKVNVLNGSVQFSKKTEHEEIPKKNLRWILTTNQFQPGGTKNFVEHKDRSYSEAVSGCQVTAVINSHQDASRRDPIKLGLPNLPVT
uniref:Uncharacterized protein n=1 Tax=Wuchereria bancrofti TaxID=6293 RepID=A0AAF5RTK3_WUCBA